MKRNKSIKSFQSFVKPVLIERKIYYINDINNFIIQIEFSGSKKNMETELDIKKNI